jgi:rare lipoprotein A
LLHGMGYHYKFLIIGPMILNYRHSPYSYRIPAGGGILHKLLIAGYVTHLMALFLCISCSSTARFSPAPAQTGDSRSAVATEKSPAIPSQSKKATLSKGREKEGGVIDHPSTTARADDGRKHDSFRQTGMASYYARKFHGRRTASGERYNMRELTAAHPHLPFGVRVRVTNLSNNRSVVVRINDRGPHAKKRIIDLSLSAAEKIGLVRSGITRVTVETVE